MGATLSSRAQWTSRYGSANTSDGGETLDASPRNEQLLYELVAFIDQIESNHKAEAAVEFVRPLQWETNLRPSHFKELRNSEEYEINQNFSPNKVAVASKTKKADGGSALVIEQSDNRRCMISVWSCKELARALEAAGDSKISELATAVTANKDPMLHIAGVANSGPGKALMNVFDELSMIGGSEAEQERRKSLFQLVLLVNALDQKLLESGVQTLQHDVRLNMLAVKEELGLLQSFAGKSDMSPLVSIEFESDYIFENGCRAPPWRQVYGELCYLSVQPSDGERFYVTATVNGYFINRGYSSSQGGDTLDYAAASETTGTLVALLKTRSMNFAANIEKQQYVFEKAREEAMVKEASQAVSLVAGAERASTKNALNENMSAAGKTDNGVIDEDEEAPSAAKLNKDARARAHDTQRRRRKNKGGSGGSRDPSSRWKNLADEGSDARKSTAAATAAATIESPMRSGKPRRRDTNKSIQVSAKPNAAPDSDSDTELSEEDDTQEKKRNEANAELPPEYWQIQKLVKYLKGGNQTATIIALCSLRDFDLQNETNPLAIRDVGGLDVLINLLDTEDPKCKMGSLRILKDISNNYQIKKAIAALDGMKPLVEVVRDGTTELKCLAAETMANCAKYARNRRAIRRYGGIRKLVRLLKLGLNSTGGGGGMGFSHGVGHGGVGGMVSAAPGHDGESGFSAGHPSNHGFHQSSVSGPHAKAANEAVARAGALALWSASKSSKNKEAIRQAGAVPLLAQLLKSCSQDLLVPVVGILQECASDTEYQALIRKEGMIKPLVVNLSTSHHELRAHCAAAIFKCAEDAETRELVREYGGLDPLVTLLQSTDNKELLAAATGAVWKCSLSMRNVIRFQELHAIEMLVSLLDGQPEEVLINAVGALGECAKHKANREAIRSAGGIPLLVNLLTGTNQALLVNVTRSIGACANDAENMAIIDRLDGVRLLWSLLKSSNPEVQASAAWGICPCIDNAKDAGEMVRSFVGGLELIVSLLKSDNVEVLAAVCAAIANIAKDEENLAVITDHGVVPMLAKLASTNNEKLRRYLAEAIARSCQWANNKVAFGEAGAVAPLVRYLKSKDVEVHRSTAFALYQLSNDAENCITMHEAGVVQLLLSMVGAQDEALQEASAGCIGNIRRLALASEKNKV